jgi:hypothetical protein
MSIATEEFSALALFRWTAGATSSLPVPPLTLGHPRAYSYHVVFQGLLPPAAPGFLSHRLPAKRPATPIKPGIHFHSTLLFIKLCGFRVPPLKQLALSRALTNQWVGAIESSGVAARFPFCARRVSCIFLNGCTWLSKPLVCSDGWHANCILSLRPWLSKPRTTPERRKQQTPTPARICRGTAFSSPFFGGDSMNRLRSVFLGLGLLIVVSSTQAQEIRVKVDIPFDFIVGNQILSAGEYMVGSEGATNQVIVIRSNDRKTAILALTNSCSSSKPSDTTKLVFHRLAGRYFLSQVWAAGNSGGRQLPESRVEVQLAKNSNARDEVALRASLTR